MGRPFTPMKIKRVSLREKLVTNVPLQSPKNRLSKHKTLVEKPLKLSAGQAGRLPTLAFPTLNSGKAYADLSC